MSGMVRSMHRKSDLLHAAQRGHGIDEGLPCRGGTADGERVGGGGADVGLFR